MNFNWSQTFNGGIQARDIKVNVLQIRESYHQLIEMNKFFDINNSKDRFILKEKTSWAEAASKIWSEIPKILEFYFKLPSLGIFF